MAARHCNLTYDLVKDAVANDWPPLALRSMWDFIHSATGDVHQLIDFLSRHPDKVHVLLKTPPAKSAVADVTDTRALMTHILFYVLDGVLPFLHVSNVLQSALPARE